MLYKPKGSDNACYNLARQPTFDSEKFGWVQPAELWTWDLTIGLHRCRHFEFRNHWKDQPRPDLFVCRDGVRDLVAVH